MEADTEAMEVDRDSGTKSGAERLRGNAYRKKRKSECMRARIEAAAMDREYRYRRRMVPKLVERLVWTSVTHLEDVKFDDSAVEQKFQHHKNCLFCGVGKEKYREVSLNRGCQVPSVSGAGLLQELSLQLLGWQNEQDRLN